MGRQRDLLEPAQPTAAGVGTMRAALVPMLARLLLEAVERVEDVEDTAGKEGDDEPDRT